MVRLLGWLIVWLLLLRIHLLSLAHIRLPCAFHIGERLWSRSFMLFFVTRHGLSFLHHHG